MNAFAAFSVLLLGTVRSLKLRSAADYGAIDVELSNHNNVQYSAAFSIGGQTLPVIYDTGSFEIIVLSTLCQVCAQQHVVYDSGRSTSYSSGGGATAEHLFGSGPVHSEKAFDTVQLGGNLQAPHMPFWQVVSHSIAVWDSSAKFSGIVGLGHRDKVPDGFGSMESDDKTLLAQLGVQRFAVCLRRVSPTAPGKLTFWPGAGIVPAGFHGLHVSGHAHWGVHMTSLKFAGISEDPCSSGCGAIVDSGTSLIAAPPSASALVNKISNMIARDCSNLHSLPVLEIQLGGVIVRLPPKAYVMQVVKQAPKNSSWNKMLFGGSRGASECSPGFMTIEKNSALGPVWVLGMPFLRYYHTIFDRTSKMLYIAPSTPSCDIAATTGFAQPVPAALHAQNMNTTQLAAAGANMTKVVASVFAEEDFEATQVDLEGLRGPSWVEENGKAQTWMDI